MFREVRPVLSCPVSVATDEARSPRLDEASGDAEGPAPVRPVDESTGGSSSSPAAAGWKRATARAQDAYAIETGQRRQTASHATLDVATRRFARSPSRRRTSGRPCQTRRAPSSWSPQGEAEAPPRGDTVAPRGVMDSTSAKLSSRVESQPERLPRPHETADCRRSSHGVWCPSTPPEASSDQHRVCLTRLCCAFRLFQPLDALFRSQPSRPCFMSVTPLGFHFQRFSLPGSGYVSRRDLPFLPFS
jgi:hypothetical protein